jgi:hypothetical protein
MPLTSVVYFIACGLLILTLIPVGKGIGDSSLLSPNWIIGIRVFSISTFIFLGVINYATPYITATVRSFKCLKCGSEMETSELLCQDCGCTFHFKHP